MDRDAAVGLSRPPPVAPLRRSVGRSQSEVGLDAARGTADRGQCVLRLSAGLRRPASDAGLLRPTEYSVCGRRFPKLNFNAINSAVNDYFNFMKSFSCVADVALCHWRSLSRSCSTAGGGLRAADQSVTGTGTVTGSVAAAGHRAVSRVMEGVYPLQSPLPSSGPLAVSDL